MSKSYHPYNTRCRPVIILLNLQLFHPRPTTRAPCSQRPTRTRRKLQYRRPAPLLVRQVLYFGTYPCGGIHIHPSVKGKCKSLRYGRNMELVKAYLSIHAPGNLVPTLRHSKPASSNTRVYHGFKPALRKNTRPLSASARLR